MKSSVIGFFTICYLFTSVNFCMHKHQSEIQMIIHLWYLMGHVLVLHVICDDAWRHHPVNSLGPSFGHHHMHRHNDDNDIVSIIPKQP